METLQIIGSYSFLAAFLVFTALSVLLIISWKKQQGPRKLLLAATFCSMLWTALSASFLAYSNISSHWIILSEFVRTTIWAVFLIHVLNLNLNQLGEATSPKQRNILFWTIYVAIFGLVILWPIAQPAFDQPITYHNSISLFGWVTISIAGLLLIEQLYRNTETGNRWSIKHLCLGLGSLFAYDFYMYSDALLFKQINPVLWNARGIVNALVVPLIAISAARNKDWNLNIHVSRSMVFHSATLVGSGIYLTIMAGAGYVIKIYGGTWGNILQISFLFGAGILLVTLLFSGKIRAKARVFLSKHFFSYRYDYREEWLQFTQTLANSGDNVPEASIKAIATLVDSPSGILWLKEGQHFDLLAHWNTPHPGPIPNDAFITLSEFWTENPWIIDLDEYQSDPDRYEDLFVHDLFFTLEDAWLIIPLKFKDELLGLMLICHSQSRNHVNWEDRDLLKMAGFQVAVYLSQFKINRALMQARQFDAFNRLSAYIVHDLKNILGQQSLLVANAEKHKHKPAFVEDVIRTLQNSVKRMTGLMDQLRTGAIQEQALKTNVVKCISDACSIQEHMRPTPTFPSPNQSIQVDADPKKLTRVLGHLIQNAQEATPDDGEIVVQLTQQADQIVIEIQDTGCGMTPEFIQEKLFTPFESTKGLTGMGIGVFESREYIRSIGGEILVTSKPSAGTTFTITLPKLPDHGDFAERN